MYDIDGATGGGSILRIALPIALAKQEDIKLTNIRKSRSKPGLRPQHLRGIELLCELTGSILDGGEVGSTTINITAGQKVQQSAAEIDIATAGSISLVYQMLSNYCMVANTSVDIVFRGGGTHTKWAPNADYLKQVTIPALELFGQQGKITTHRVGYYPKGGANGLISIKQADQPGRVQLDTVEGRAPIRVISRASNHLQNAKVAERQLQGLLNHGISPTENWIYYDESDSVGSVITAWIVEPSKMYRGFSQLGKQGVKAETIGQQLANLITSYQEPAAVDEYLADQLMVALSQSESGAYYSMPKITNHITSNLNLINSILEDNLALQDHGEYYLLQKL